MISNKPHWFVAYVKSCQERKLSEKLTRYGMENYVPIQKCRRQWSDRVKVVDVLVLPRMIFVHCTPVERENMMKVFPDQFHFMSEGGPYNPVVIPDIQIETFRRMVELGKDEVKVTSEPLIVGDHVEIVEGPLKGCRCRLLNIGSRTCIGVSLGRVGLATIEIPISDVHRIEDPEIKKV